MTTLTITIPDSKAKEISSYIEENGGTIVSTVSEPNIKRAQQASLKQGIKEAVLVSQGKLKSAPLSELWDE